MPMAITSTSELKNTKNILIEDTFNLEGRRL